MSGAVRHPGGIEMTEYLLDLAGIRKPCQGRAADLGAGDGCTVRLLCDYGFDAEGIDLKPAENVRAGDMLKLPFADGSPVRLRGREWYACGGEYERYSCSVCADEPLSRIRWMEITF